MEEAPKNGKESWHSAHAHGMNEWMNAWMCLRFTLFQWILTTHDTNQWQSFKLLSFSVCP
jgi:hypothetical protein